MRILAVDTTSAFGSIALQEHDRLLEEIPLHSPEGFSQVLFDFLYKALYRHDWSIEMIDCFAAASGPGSFTGVRVGLAAIKGLAEGTGKTAIAISNLQALATYGTGLLRAVVMDARRGEVYGAVYDAEARVVAEEHVLRFQDWVYSLPEGVSSIVSPDFAAFRANFPLDLPVIEQRVIAGAVAQIAGDQLGSGLVPDVARIDANYVRRSDAELFWRDR